MCILVAQQSAYYYYDRPRERERRAGETEQNIHIVPYRMIIYFELGFLSVFYFSLLYSLFNTRRYTWIII